MYTAPKVVLEKAFGRTLPSMSDEDFADTVRSLVDALILFGGEEVTARDIEVRLDIAGEWYNLVLLRGIHSITKVKEY